MDEHVHHAFFETAVMYLLGQRLPELPAIPGRVHKAPPPEAIDRRLQSYAKAAAFAASVAPGWRGWRP